MIADPLREFSRFAQLIVSQVLSAEDNLNRIIEEEPNTALWVDEENGAPVYFEFELGLSVEALQVTMFYIIIIISLKYLSCLYGDV